MKVCKKQVIAFFLVCLLFVTSVIPSSAAEKTKAQEQETKQTKSRSSTVETLLGTDTISPTETITHKKEVEVVSSSGECTGTSLPDLKGVEEVPLTKKQLKKALDPQSEFEMPKGLTRASTADTVNGPSSIISAGS